MKKIIESLSSLPKWYGFLIVLIYALLTAEFIALLSDICLEYGMQISDLVETFMQISYIIIILSCIFIWITLSLLYHFMAVLFDGKAKFKDFLGIASYPFALPAIAIVIAILLLDHVGIREYEGIGQFMEQSKSYQLAIGILNYSFIPYYLLVACIIHYLYNLKWLYALLSVAIPVVSIYAVTELFKLVM